MEKSLFHPKKIELPRHIVLIPQFWDKVYYKELKSRALVDFQMVLSDFLIFEDYVLVVGFLGYPHILTILEFIEDIRNKEIYFLGTAGSLNEAFNRPMILDVTEIHSSSILDHFNREKSFSLAGFPGHELTVARGVTVDIIQRETVPWLKEQTAKGIDFVEMELFPLRVYLGKPFRALVVTSDILREGGIHVFPHKALLRKEFVKAYEMIVRYINEK